MPGLTVLFDLETDGLLDTVSKIHCVGTYIYETNTLDVYDNERLEEGIELLKKADTLVGHNIIGYDIQVLKKLYPEVDWYGKNIRDTLVWARLVWSDIKNQIDWKMIAVKRLPPKMLGRHSLEAYGYRFKVYKGEFGKTSDWKTWSPEMSEYCKQDVIVTYKLYTKLVSEQYSKEAIALEHDVAKIIARQTEYGFKFNIEKAMSLIIDIRTQKNLLEEKLSHIKPFIKRKGMFTPARNNKTRGYLKGVPFCKIEIVDFNPTSHAHIGKFLMRDYNWKPTEFTEKTGEPTISDVILSDLVDLGEEVTTIRDYLVLSKILGFLVGGNQAWMKCVKEDGRIHGGVITNGAVTGRMTHRAPNIAQTPGVSCDSEGKPILGLAGGYGYECRGLFEVKEGYKLVGCDASGLELRMLGHYLAWFDNGEYADVVVNGDIHTMNQKAAGLEKRSQAKTFIYGFLYGAGEEKIGSIVGGSSAEGKALKNKFFKKIPALKKLVDSVKAKTSVVGELIGLDGRRLFIRAQHAALNVLLQSAGALVMKKGLVVLDTKLQEEGLVPGDDYEFVANIHDEWQIEVKEEYAERVSEIAVWAIQEAGRLFNMKCPLDGEAKIGTNWAETH